MTAAEVEEHADLLSVDELAAATGLTVRTTRYYAGLGLLPPPVRRGRMAFYGPEHRARLELVRALQDHGFTLSAIEKYLAKISNDASVEELALQRAMLTSWSAGTAERLTLRQLEKRAGRSLSAEDLELLDSTSAVRRIDDRFELLAPFEVATQLLALDIPRESVLAAANAITTHMDSLADELTTILHERVLAPFRQESPDAAEQARMEKKMAQLRRLTLEAVVTGFQRAANQVISRSLAGPEPEHSSDEASGQ